MNRDEAEKLVEKLHMACIFGGPEAIKAAEEAVLSAIVLGDSTLIDAARRERDEWMRESLAKQREIDALKSAMTRPASARPGEYVAPIAKATVVDGLVHRCGMYAPGLPDGEHDLYPVGRSEPGLDALRRHIELLRRALKESQDRCFQMALPEPPAESHKNKPTVKRHWDEVAADACESCHGTGTYYHENLDYDCNHWRYEPAESREPPAEARWCIFEDCDLDRAEGSRYCAGHLADEIAIKAEEDRRRAEAREVPAAEVEPMPFVISPPGFEFYEGKQSPDEKCSNTGIPLRFCTCVLHDPSVDAQARRVE